MAEMIDVVDQFTGEPTGERVLKSLAHQKGIWHGSIHIIIINKDHSQTLLQKRSSTKSLYPNMWDIAVGGHIKAGESPLNAASRELEEELGLNINQYEVEEAGKIQEVLNNGGVYSREVVTIYIIYADIDLDNISLQTDEVSKVGWFTKEKLNQIIEKGKAIPHGKEYEILNSQLNQPSRLVLSHQTKKNS